MPPLTFSHFPASNLRVPVGKRVFAAIKITERGWGGTIGGFNSTLCVTRINVSETGENFARPIL